MPGENIAMLETVANGLGDLKDEIVFVGGAVAELYADHPAASDIRPTLDIDCVIELKSRTAYAKTEDKLRTKGFVNDTSNYAPICRWVYKEVKVDIMPTDSKILGFTNKWYQEGIKNKIEKTLPDGTKIHVFPLEYFLATKFEAYKNRGGTDLRQSHDFEDIIYLFDNCSELFENIFNSNTPVKTYLIEECKVLYGNTNLTEGIESALPYATGEKSTYFILETLRRISEIS